MEPSGAVTPPGERSPGRLWTLLVAGVALAGYGATLLRTVGVSGDTAKFQFAGHVFGTAHAPGYPLYLLANGFFTHLLPLGEVPFRANLLSALFAVLALVLLFRLLHGALDVPAPVAAGASLAFGFSRTFWSLALVAEVYSLHLVFVTAVLLLLLRWNRDLSRAGAAPGAEGPWLAFALLALGQAHHLLIVALVPPVALFLLKTSPRTLHPRRWPALGALVLLGLAPYAYIFQRTFDSTTRYLEMRTPDLASLLWYLTGAQFRGRFPAFTPAELATERLPLLIEAWGRQLGMGVLPGPVFAGLALVLGILVVAGVVRLGRSSAQLLLGGALIFNTLLALSYDIPDIAAYFLPSTLVVTIYLALGLAAFGGLLATRLQGAGRGLGRAAPGLLAAALAAGLFLVHRPGVDLSDFRRDADRAEAILAAVPGNAVVIARDYLSYETLMAYRMLDLGDGGDVVVLGLLADEGLQHRVRLFLEKNPPPEGVRRQFEATRTPEHLRRYLEDGVPLELLGERRTVPPGRPVFADGEAQRNLLVDAGLECAPAGPGLFRITPGLKPDPPETPAPPPER